MNNNHIVYGRGDATFQAVGGEEGLRQLVDTFYDIMKNNADYRTIWDWHPKDKQLSRDKLYRFLCGWMGGPSKYRELYGAINLPTAHAHLSVGHDERNMWLNCMREAMKQTALPAELIVYLLDQLARPAEIIQKTCENRRAGFES